MNYKHRKSPFKGYYCTACETVWVQRTNVTTGQDERLPEFPSYGIVRKTCSECTGIAAVPKEKPETLA